MSHRMNERLTFFWGRGMAPSPNPSPRWGRGHSSPHLTPRRLDLGAYDASTLRPLHPTSIDNFWLRHRTGRPTSFPEHSIGNEVCRYNWLWRHDAGSMIARKKRRERSSLRVANESRFTWSSIDEYGIPRVWLCVMWIARFWTASRLSDWAFVNA